MLAIIAGLPIEGKMIKSRCGVQKVLKLTDSTLLCVSGMGPENAQIAAQKCIDSGATALLSFGSAVGLCPNIRPGRLIIPKIIKTKNNTYYTDKHWYDGLTHLFAKHILHHHTAMNSSQEILTKPEKKWALFQNNNTVAADMESGAIAKLAHENNLPFMALRAVADPQSMVFPESVLLAMGEKSINLKKLGFNLAKRPKEIKHLIKLSKHFNAAKKTLDTTVNLHGLEALLPPVV